MSRVDDNVAVFSEWVPPSPSPRTFFSAMLGDTTGSKPPENNKSEGLFLGPPGRLNLAAEQRSNSRGGLGERIAARVGFNAPRLNTEGMRYADLSKKPEVLSPYLTIPPGLSPTTLLDSPVFLSNSSVQPSPTTGKFAFLPNNTDKGSSLVPDTLNATKQSQFKGNCFSSFTFNPLVDSVGSSFFGSGSNVHPQNDSVYHSPTEYSQILITNGPDRSLPLDDQGDEEEDARGSVGDPMVGGGDGPAEDGYNWRKYGQKQVKGSEYPRSYYKCTYTNCTVKKKVERSHEGHITEIIYQGMHKHPKPLLDCPSVIREPDDVLGNMLPEMPGADGDPVGANRHNAVTAGDADWRQDNNHEVTSSPSDGPGVVGNPTLSLPVQNRTCFKSIDQVDGSSTFSNDEGEDDQQTHASVSMGYGGDGDESESKRRKIEACALDVSGATRAIREPRVVVQTTSEVDVLDDGYRWRKYGQKVVKGNPNPRSYYKCTSAGCTVRKHVERACHDLKSVITTYEGKHNHDVPAARNSSHANSGAIPAQAATGVRNQAHRPEPSQVHSMMARFDRPSSLCPITLPGGRAPLLGPSHGVSFRMSQMGLANLGMVGGGLGQGKLPMMQVHPFLMQQCPANDMGIMLPKGEAKIEPGSETGSNLSNSMADAVYQQMLNRLPLGHQM